MVTISVLIATVNRPSLLRSLESCRGADEIILVADGEEATGASEVLRDSGLPGRCIVLPVAYKDFGHTPRQIGLGYCQGDFIAHLDDDDVYLPGAIEGIRVRLREPRPHIFRAQLDHVGLIWRTPEIQFGNLTTDLFIHPNNRRFGVWSARWGGDFDFIRTTCAHYPEGPVWCDYVIAHAEQSGTPAEQRHYGKMTRQPAPEGPHLSPALLRVLACPACRQQVQMKEGGVVCERCQKRYRLQEGRPVFLPEQSAPVVSRQHTSNDLPTKVKEWLRTEPGLVLNLGAGGSHDKWDNCIEVERAIFRHTDVVADAHCLPFLDSSFDAVITFNTFEHLHSPTVAATEIHRVLKPRGRVILTTAFLQPLHEAPDHFYNATEFGVRRWFEGFDICTLDVSENFNPAHVLAWTTWDLLQAVTAAFGAQAAQQLAASPLSYWIERWIEHDKRKGSLWEMLGKLPQEAQKGCAAGFHMEAVKPG